MQTTRSNAQDVLKLIELMDSSDGSSNGFPKSIFTTKNFKYIINRFGYSIAKTGFIIPTIGADTNINHSLVTIHDKNDSLVSYFTTTLSMSISRINTYGELEVFDYQDSVLLLITSLKQDVYINGILQLAKDLNSTQKGKRLLTIDKHGNVTQLAKIDVTSFGDAYNSGSIRHIESGFRLSKDKKYFYAMYNTVTDFDSTQFDTSIFKPGFTTILKYDTKTGALNRTFLVPNQFDRFDILDSTILLYGFDPKFTPSYQINQITYQKDTADKSKYDLILGGFSETTNTLIWHTILKNNYYLGQIKVFDQSVFCSFYTKDTLRINNQLIGEVSGSFYDVLASLNINGQLNWGKTIKNGRIYELNQFHPNEICLTLYADATGGSEATNFRYGGKYYPRTTWNSNYFHIDAANGNVLANFSIGFIRDYNMVMTGQYSSRMDSTNYVAYNLRNQDSILINGKYYYKKIKSPYYHQSIIAKVKINTAVLPLNQFEAKPLAATRMAIRWKKDSSYQADKMSVLVFAKEIDKINTAANNTNPIFWFYNTNFAGNSSTYSHDSLAKFCYIGDEDSVVITGLKPNTKYHFTAFVVRDFDYIYSTPINDSNVTFKATILPPSNLKFEAISFTDGKLSWHIPDTLNPKLYSTKVFAKKASAINIVDTVLDLKWNYKHHIAFGNGDAFFADSNAFCVYNGDSNHTIITGLERNMTYYFMAYMVRPIDTIVSNPIFETGFIPIPPFYPIGKIAKTNLQNGNPDSIGIKVKVQGIVYGNNQVDVGTKLVLRDSTGGITIQNLSKKYNLSIKEGDKLEVEGTVVSHRGLASLDLDTILFVSGNHNLQVPHVTNKPGEVDENDLITIDSIRFISIPNNATWPLNDTIIKVINVQLDTISIKLIGANLIGGFTIPYSKLFSITGLGSQVSSSISAPYLFDGYEIIPRYIHDIDEIPNDSLLPFGLMNPLRNTSIVLEKDTNSKVFFNWQHARSAFSKVSGLYTVEMDSLPTFTNLLYSGLSSNNGKDSFINVTYLKLSEMAALKQGQSKSIYWRVKATFNGFDIISDTFALNLVRGKFNTIKEIDIENDFILFPNPTSQTVSFISKVSPLSFTITDLQGREIMKNNLATGANIIPIPKLSDGCYFVVFLFENGISIKRKLLIKGE